MKKIKKHELRVNTETVRVLTKERLQPVQGGVPPDHKTPGCGMTTFDTALC